MRVMLRSYTAHPEDICGLASRTCVSEEPLEVGPDDLEKSLASAMKSGHLSVLEHAVFTFYIEGISRACSHQLVRHRMASYAQQSQRYVNMTYSKYVTPKSISECVAVDDPVLASYEYDAFMEQCFNFYETLVDWGIPEEDARYVLPNACCTNIVVTMNTRSLLNFFQLRLCRRAQWEIREMATLMLEEVRKVAPALFETAGPACARGPCPEGKRSCGHPWSKEDKVSALDRLWQSMTQEERERAIHNYMSEWEKEELE